MPDVLAFPGIRYDCDAVGADLGVLAAPPYDVVDDDLQASLESAHERNSVRLILPRDETNDGDRYERAAATFRRWLADGTLVRDPAPRYYGYRMRFTDAHGVARHTHGVIGALRLPNPGDTNGVLPHERTLPKAKSDRLSLLSAMRVNVDPIWGLSLTPGLTDLLEPAVPLCRAIDTDGAGAGDEHELFGIDDPTQIEAIHRAIAATPLVLADGHHRFETACNYRQELRDAGLPVGGADSIMTFVVELSEDELCIDPIHRLVAVPDGLDVRAALADAFDIAAVGPNTPEVVEQIEARMRAAGALGLVDRHGIALATPRREITDRALESEPEPVRATDSALVETVVVPRLPDSTWAYRHDATAVAALVEKAMASAAFLCNPVSVAQTRAAALAGVRMPQKTTFFSPKPRTGMVFRSLD
ncbi:MAG: hypothetical protein JWL83_358 [Actinomycetia bacterium]|nr:hypothetical protein [Actinomycetes bacterium]